MRYLAPLLVVLALLSSKASPHDHDHPEQDAWYKTLMQPDVPNASCCGEADAYWCDDVFVKRNAGGEKTAYCRITDDRDVPGRPHVDVGTEVEIPTLKLKWDAGNPTGHNVLFMNSVGYVFCFVQGTGI